MKIHKTRSENQKILNGKENPNEAKKTLETLKPPNNNNNTDTRDWHKIESSEKSSDLKQTESSSHNIYELEDIQRAQIEGETFNFNQERVTNKKTYFEESQTHISHK
ncbi:22592_t:CDS:2 [Cetraspora pellucida]|uniref:22592_t:CDS:1 n=1 Tax=Cetraspora pellucida TaxID=1433469 RepID=A0A9N9NEB8_9GLOM|nr:22592_t:CDS:2 [Cetraspora pellucida]